MLASFKTCPPYAAGVVYSLLIGPKTISLTALMLSLAHAPNRETLPLRHYLGIVFKCKQSPDKVFKIWPKTDFSFCKLFFCLPSLGRPQKCSGGMFPDPLDRLTLFYEYSLGVQKSNFFSLGR